MKTLFHRLLDRALPWRVTIRGLQRELQEQIALRSNFRAEADQYRREADSLRQQNAETRRVNLHNAAAHRASEVAALMSNNAQNAEIERLRLLAEPGKRHQLPESRDMPAIHVPKPIPVTEPKSITP